MLSDAQKRAFVRAGHLVVPDAVDPRTVARAREAVREAADADPDDPETWPTGENVNLFPPEDVADADPFRAINDRLHEYCAALVGEGLLTRDGGASLQVALRYPRAEGLRDPEAPQLSDVSSHVDGYLDVEGGEGDVVPHTVMASLYLDRVEPYGGGFTAWPGSHRDVCEYFRDHPVQEGKGGVPAPDGRGGWSDRPRDEVFDPLELTGGAGTVVLWHGRLEHEGGINLSERARTAAIKRFFHEDAERFQAEAPEEPFRGWEGLAGVVETA